MHVSIHRSCRVAGVVGMGGGGWEKMPLSDWDSSSRRRTKQRCGSDGNSESDPFIISSGNTVILSPFSHTLRSEPSGIRNPEFDCSLSGASIQVLHDVLGIRNPETGLSLLHRPGERSESGIRNLKSLVQPETNARVWAIRNPESGISLGRTQSWRTRWDC